MHIGFRHHWFCGLLWLGWLGIAAQAQDRPYRFDHWTMDNGMPANGVYALLQSRDGYLWMTTVDGLVRFDGVRFTVFNKGNSPGIESNRLVEMTEDKQGRLWARTDSGDLLLKDGERFTTWTAKNGLPGALKYGIAADGAGGLIFKTDQGFYRWYEGRFSPWQFPGGRPDSVLLKQAHDDDGLWFTDTAGLHQLRDGQLKHWATEAPVTSVYPDRHGALWWVTAGNCNAGGRASSRPFSRGMILSGSIPSAARLRIRRATSGFSFPTRG